MKKLCVLLAAVLCLSCLLCFGASAVESGELPGFYRGSCTTQQVDMGLELTVLEKKLLASDDVLLDALTACTGSELSRSTLRSAVEAHDGQYIGILYFYPKSEERSGSGMYTLNVKKGDNGYELTGSQWLWQGGGSFMDLMNLSLSGGKLTGDVYAEYSFIFWNKYGDVGDVSLTKQTGDRVYFPQSTATVSQYRKQALTPELRNHRGETITEAALTWSSSDEAVISVTTDGTLLPLTPGTAKITARSEGGFEASCNVTVTEAEPPVNIQVTTELLSQITQTVTDGRPVYQFAPNYKITALITNPTPEAITGLTVRLEGAELYEGEALTQTFDSIPAGQAQEVSWSVVVPADRNTGGQFPLTVTVESQEYAPIPVAQTLDAQPFDGTDNRLSDSDRWFFTNIPSVFKNGYTLSDGYLQTLGNVERARIEDYLADGWQGSDYGMAVVAALMKAGVLNPGDYRQGAASLSQLPSPRDDSAVSQLITEYQVSFLRSGVAELWEAQLQLSRSQRLQGLVDAVQLVEFGGMPVVISFRYQENGTANALTLVGYALEYDNYSMKNPLSGQTETYDKRVVLYDPNATEPIYLYITKECDRFYLEGYCRSIIGEDGALRRDGEGYFVYATTPEQLLPQGAELGVRLESDVPGNVTPQSGQGFQMGGANLSGTPLSYLGTYGVCYIPAFPQALTVTPSGIARLTCTYPGMLLSAETKSVVLFSPEGGIALQTPEEPYLLRAVFDAPYGTKGWHTFTFDGFGTVEISREKGGSIRIAGDVLRGIRVWAKGTEEFSKTIASDATELILKEENGTLVLLADPDGDGVFSTPAEEVTAPQDTPDDPKKPGQSQSGDKSGGNGWKVVVIVILILVALACVAGIVFVLKTGIVTIRINPPKKK